MPAKPNLKFTFLFALLCATLVSCDDDNSTDLSRDVNTNRTYVDIRVSASDSQTVSASVQLLNANPIPDNQIALTDGDALWFSYGENITQIPLDSNGNLFDGFRDLSDKAIKLSDGQEVRFLLWNFWLLGDTWYDGHLDEVEDETYYVSYIRPNYPNSLNSSVTLPARFTITAPLANEIHSRGNDIVINWQPSGTTLNVEMSVFIDCRTGSSTNLTDHRFISVPSDSGTYTIVGGTLVDPAISGNCFTTVELSKNRTGTLDSGLYGGGIIGERFSTVTTTTSD